MNSYHTFSRHLDSIYYIAFSPDGQRLASASRDGTAIVWEISSGQIEHMLSHQGRGKVLSVAFSPDGKLLAMCSEDGIVSVWDTGSWQNHFMAKATEPRCLIFSPDSSTVLVGCYKQVLCWDVKTSQPVRSLSIPPETCVSLDFSPDGKMLAAAMSEGSVIFFDSQTWLAKKTLWVIPPNYPGHVNRCIFSPGAETCAVSIQIRQRGSIGRTFNPDNYEIAIWNYTDEDGPDHDRNLVGPIGWIGALGFSPGGDLLASGSYDESVYLWNPHSHSLVTQFHEHEGAIYGIAFSPDGELLATCSADRTIKLWRVAEVKEALKFSTKDPSLLNSEHITMIMRDAEDHRRNGVIVAAQDILDRLLALDSLKALEDAVMNLFPLISAPNAGLLAQVLACVIFAIQFRLEQAYREGDLATADFYNRFGLLISAAMRRPADITWEELAQDLPVRDFSGASAIKSPPTLSEKKLPRPLQRDSIRLPRTDSPNRVASRPLHAGDLTGLLLQVISGELTPDDAQIRGRAMHPSVFALVKAGKQLEVLVDAARRGRANPSAIAAAAEVLFHLAEPVAPSALLSSICNEVGIPLSLSGAHNEGIDWLERAVEFAEASDEPIMKTSSLGNLGNVYRNVGRLQDAQRAYVEAIAIAEQAASVTQSAPHAFKRLWRRLLRITSMSTYRFLLQTFRINHLNNLSIVYRDLGDRQAEEQTLRKALAVARVIGSVEHLAGVFNNLGGLYEARNDKQGALEYFLESLAMTERAKDDRFRASVLGNLGSTCQALGRFDEALHYYTQGLEIAKRLGLATVLSNDLVRVGKLYIDMGETSLARQSLEQALEVSRRQQEPSPRLAALMTLAQFHEMWSPDPHRELQLLQEAARIGETMREQLSRPDEGRKIHDDLSNLYTRLVRINLDEGRIDEAFIASEHARAALLLKELRSRRSEEDAGGSEDELSIYAEQGLPIDALFDHLRRLGPHAVIISYFVTANLLYTFILRADDGRIRCVERPVEAGALDRIREAFTREVSLHPLYGNIGETWLDLGQYVIDPIVEYLQPEDVLFFVSHGPLHNLPLHGLKVGGSRLIERWPIAYLPSVSALPFLLDTSPGPPQAPIVIGIQFMEEAQAIAELLGADGNLISTSIEKETVLNAMRRGDAIHVSAYGFASRHQPDKSGWFLQAEAQLENYLVAREKPGYAVTGQDMLLMSMFQEKAGNQIISVADLASLRLHAKMVSVSTCESGFVHTSPAEDPVGVVRGLLVAGVLTVVASLWLVDPEATHKLMLHFYQHLGHSATNWRQKPQALRLAMLDVMREQPHSYYWAPFVLIGGAAIGVAVTEEK